MMNSTQGPHPVDVAMSDLVTNSYERLADDGEWVSCDLMDCPDGTTVRATLSHWHSVPWVIGTPPEENGCSR